MRKWEGKRRGGGGTSEAPHCAVYSTRCEACGSFSNSSLLIVHLATRQSASTEVGASIPIAALLVGVGDDIYNKCAPDIINFNGT